MVVGHLMIGVVLGLLAAAASLLMGYSAWAAFGFYVLGGNVGLALSVAVQMVLARQVGPRPTSADTWLTPAE